jgi:ketosteroid isomerase-like protein
MEANDEVAAAVLGVLDAWAAAAAQGDGAAQRPFFADDADVMLIGSADWELSRGPAELDGFFATANGVPSWSTWRERHVSHTGDVAWAFADGEFTWEFEGRRNTIPYRMTVILERRGDRWVIVHYHGSEPATSDPPSDG